VERQVGDGTNVGGWLRGRGSSGHGRDYRSSVLRFYGSKVLRFEPRTPNPNLRTVEP
jgi:hypothetical protein